MAKIGTVGACHGSLTLDLAEVDEMKRLRKIALTTDFAFKATIADPVLVRLAEKLKVADSTTRKEI